MRGVIFDFNGTIVFDEKFHFQAWQNFFLEKTGMKIEQEEYQKYFQGVNIDVILEKYIPQKIGKAEVAELAEEKESMYRQICLESEDFKFADGLKEFLDALKKNHVPMTIATAAGLENVKFFFEHFKLDEWFNFEYVVYDDGTLPGKPAPDIFLKAAEVIGVEISDCIIFEDSRSGIKAAKNSGAYKVIGITSTLDEKTLLERGATNVISDYTNLNSLLELVCKD